MSQDFFFRSLSIWRRCMVPRWGTVSSRLPTGRIFGVVSHCYCLSRDCYFRASQQCHICSLSAKHRELRASVLRTTLFALIFTRIVKTFGWQLWTLLGADDLILFCVSRNSDTIERLLQVAVHRVSHLPVENVFSCFPAKSRHGHVTCLWGLRLHTTECN